jgi:hypothetical protein
MRSVVEQNVINVGADPEKLAEAKRLVEFVQSH